MNLVVLVFTLFFSPVCRGQCPVGWKHYEDYCIVLDTVQVGWLAAAGSCRAFSGHLARIESVSQNNNIITYLSDQKYFKPVWIDGNDQLVLGQWVWASNGQPLTFTNWSPMEPDLDGTQDCMAVVHDHISQWRSRVCSSKYAFVCQMDARMDMNASSNTITLG